MSATRTEREQELEERGRRNEVMVRSTKVLHQQFLKKDRPEIRAGSPEREEKALEQHFQTSAETLNRKRTAEDPEYDGYLKSARSGAPTDVSTVGDAKKRAVAQQANQEGSVSSPRTGSSGAPMRCRPISAWTSRPRPSAARTATSKGSARLSSSGPMPQLPDIWRGSTTIPLHFPSRPIPPLRSDWSRTARPATTRAKPRPRSEW